MNWFTQIVRGWIKRVIVLFSQGLAPRELALSITLGSLIGILPLIGVATIAITAIAIYMKLNLPIAVFMSYAISPIHILLFIPFIRIGEWLFSVEHALLTISSVRAAFEADYFQAMSDMVFQIACGLAGWMVAAVPGSVVLYVILKFLLSMKMKLQETK